MQVKRIHEYKRQLMNILAIVYRYEKLKQMTIRERLDYQPRIHVIAGKAASSYDTAKKIIGLAADVGSVINNDKDTREHI